MKGFIKVIGCLVFTLGLVSIPIICTLAWVFNWSFVLKYLATLMCASLVFYVTDLLYCSIE